MRRSKAPRPTEKIQASFADTFQTFEDKPGGTARDAKRNGRTNRGPAASRERFASLARMIDNCVLLAHHLDPKGHELEDVLALLRIARQNVVQKTA
jgi:hypothetical protein